LTMTLTVLNMIFSLAAIGVMLEKAQKRGAYRIPVQIANLPAWIHRGHERFPVVLDDISHAGAGLLVSHGLARNEKVILEVAIPAWGHAMAHIPARLVRHRYIFSRRWNMGLLFEPESMDEKRAIIALVYGDSNLHLTNQRRRQRRIGLLEGLMFLIKTAFTHAWENFLFLTHLFFARLVQRVIALFPLSSNSPSQFP
ncbi:MAG: PilZ domain-containing protein, partial [Gammaproteobacteria bacterium]|nr:PilZ domain-containing protein [Gammaproteobacteria bacterium]